MSTAMLPDLRFGLPIFVGVRVGVVSSLVVNLDSVGPARRASQIAQTVALRYE